MGKPQHLGGDRWRVRIYARDPVTGRETQPSKSFRASGPRAAARKASEVEAELRRQVEHRSAELAERRGSMAELVDDWLRVKGRTLSESTMIAYRRHAEAIKARFGMMRAAELTGSDIDEWYTDLAASGATEATIAVTHRHLRAVLRFGYTKRSLPTVATDRATPSSWTPAEIDPPSPQQLVAVLAAMPADPHVQWARAVALIAFTGLRRGEVVGLRWDGWDDQSDTLTIRHSVIEVPGGIVVRPRPKGKRERKVPLVVGARLLLERQREWADTTGVTSPWVFPDLLTDDTGGTPRRPGWISLMWARNRAKLGAPEVRLHDLRHAFATMLLDDQVPVNTVQGWLGHAKASTTIDIYGHRGKAGEIAGRAALTNALGPGTPTPPRRRLVVRRPSRSTAA